MTANISPVSRYVSSYNPVDILRGMWYTYGKNMTAELKAPPIPGLSPEGNLSIVHQANLSFSAHWYFHRKVFLLMKNRIFMLITMLIVLFLTSMLAGVAEDAPYEAGSIITFGNFEQDNNLNNGPEAIEWIVLDTDPENGKILLLSLYGLECRNYHTEDTYPTWEKCDSRLWLNDDFYNAAFSNEEKECIVSTVIKTQDNAIWEELALEKIWHYDYMDGGADCEDKVFLLSLEEAVLYSGYNTFDEARVENDRLKMVPTKYAMSHGANAYRGNGTAFRLNGVGCGWWWLRSPGISSFDATVIEYDGSIRNRGISTHTSLCIRPTIWLDLNMYENTAD